MIRELQFISNPVEANRPKPHLKQRRSIRTRFGLGIALSFCLLFGLSPAIAQNDQRKPMGDASLETALRLASERAPETMIGQAAVETSRSNLVGARLLPLQNPYVEVVVERSGLSGSRETGALGTLWLPFEFAGQRGKRIDEANASIDYQIAALNSARAEAKAAVLKAWGRAIIEGERIRLLEVISSSAQSEMEAFRTRSAVGDATARDALLAEVEHARLTIELEAALVSRDAAYAELARLTGQTWTLPEKLHILPATNLDKLSEAVANHAPAVQTSRAEATFHGRTADRVSRDAVPPMSLILMGGRGDVGDARLGAGLAFTLPTFRSNQGERARALAEQSRSLTQAAVLNRDISARLTQIINEWRGTRRAVELLRVKALPAAQRARESTEVLFSAGKVDLLAVMVSRRDEALLRLRHLDLAEREWELLSYWVKLSGELP
jgi:cobalt-zinc-cadmium efflux system outer membrane protein